MKKVLIVIPTLEQGGGEKLVLDLAKYIDRNKFQVRVLVYYKSTNSFFEQEARACNIDVLHLNKKVGLDIGFFKQVKKAVKEFAPDVIHSHVDTMLYLLPVYKKSQIKLHTVHTVAYKEARNLQKLVRVLAYKLRGVIPVAISNMVADSISKEYSIAEKDIPVVYNGVDCERYSLPKVENENINLISAGKLYAVKNYGFLIDCFCELCKFTDNVHLTILGDGVQRGELEAKIEENHLQEKITLAGLVGDVEKYLASADIYVASSTYEGLPLTVLEAMASGLPVISTDVGGISEVVKDGENGILVSPGDEIGYVNALKNLVFDEEKRMRFACASKTYSQKYDIKQMVDGYEKLYQAE